MHGLHALRGALRRRLRDERGWALIDALASAVVVVFAFVGTTMAFNGSTASVARDQKKTQAMIVAQNSINEMRGLGQRDIDGLLALNNTTKSVVYRGVTYTVAFDAYYVTGLGSDQQDACASTYTSGGGTARYIYMRAVVTYPGQSTSASGNADPYLSAPASLDSYYSPEGGGVQGDTGTLRVYILDRNNAVATGVSNVQLYVSGTTTSPIAPQTSNTTNGCYLFTGLYRNNYYVKVSVSSKQDIYMTNSSTASAVTLPVVMPDRGALSREVRIDAPVTVAPRFYTSTGSVSKYQVTSGGGANAFFGKWIAASDQIKAAPSADYSYIPSGIAFMPHQATATAATLPNAMFPNAQGYSAYAGPCDANDPNAGVDEFTNNQVQIPLTSPDSNWVPSGTYTPELWLSQIRSSVTVTPNSLPSPTTASRTYYYNQAFNGNATVEVRLVADQAGGTTSSRCKPSTNLFNTWVTLGTISSSGATLSDDAEALPTGTYDVCVSWPWRLTRGVTNWANSLSTSTLTGTSYFSAPAQVLGYRTAVTLPFSAVGNVNSSTPVLDSYGQTTDCTA